MEEQEPESIRIIDKREEKARLAAEQEVARQERDAERGQQMPPEDLEAAMRAQAEAAAAEDAAQSHGFQCATFIVLTLDRQGNARLWSRMAEIMEMQTNGIEPDREATANDIINMSAQLRLISEGGEIAARVINGLAQQAIAAQQAMGRPVPVMGPNGIDPRIQQAARRRG